MIIYDGPSQLPGDGGTPIIAVLTGLNGRSTNGKTGNMLQTWILLRDVNPSAALDGDDEAICGDCIHRRRNGRRTCYVNVGHAPRSVWAAYQRGRYETVDPDHAGLLATGRKVRVGSYGDPAAVPSSVWRSLIANAAGHTGYTHQWRDCADISDICMASCETEEDVLDAWALGYRTFRVMEPHQEAMEGELVCPASEEMGKLTTCERCGLCAGAMRHKPNVIRGIAIYAHGSSKKYYSVGTPNGERQFAGH